MLWNVLSCVCCAKRDPRNLYVMQRDVSLPLVCFPLAAPARKPSATHCNTLQHTAPRHNTPQTAKYRNTPQHSSANSPPSLTAPQLTAVGGSGGEGGYLPSPPSGHRRVVAGLASSSPATSSPRKFHRYFIWSNGSNRMIVEWVFQWVF